MVSLEVFAGGEVVYGEGVWMELKKVLIFLIFEWAALFFAYPSELD